MSGVYKSHAFQESESDDFDDTPEPSVKPEELEVIDETIKNVSRNLRKGDWTYLSRHPEVRAIIRVIVTEAIKKKPDNIFKFASDLFDASKKTLLTKLINKQLKWVNKQTRRGTWTHPDGTMLFTQSSSEEQIKNPCDKPIFTTEAEKGPNTESNHVFRPGCPQPDCEM